MKRGNQTVVTVSTQDLVVLSANPHRKGLIISNSGPGGVLLSAGSPANATQGILIQPNIAPLEFYEDRWGSWPGMELHGFGVAAPATGGSQSWVAKTVYGKSISAPSTGTVLLSYTVPAGKQSVFVMGIYQQIVGSPTAGMHVIPNGGSAQDLGGIMVNGAYSPFYLYMLAGDQIQMQVVAGGAGNTVDAALSIQEYSTTAGTGGGSGGVLTIWAVED